MAIFCRRFILAMRPRAPFIVRWSGHVRGDRIERQQVGHVIDVMPTVLVLARAAYPSSYVGRSMLPAEGKDLAPALSGESFEREPLFWEHEGNRAVRVGQWKLVAAEARTGSCTTSSPTRDRTSDELEIATTLRKLYDEWANRRGVQSWSIKP